MKPAPPSAPASAGETHRERLRALTRQAILRVAESVVLRAGLGALTLDGIAAELGLPKHELYDHYPSREALVGELALQEWTAAADAVHEATLAASSAEDALESLVRSYVSRYTGRLKMFQLATQFTSLSPLAAQLGREHLDAIRPLNDRMYGPTEGKLRHAQAAGRAASSLDPRRLAFIAHTSAMGLLLMQSMVSDLDDSLRHSESRLADELCRVLRQLSAAALRVQEELALARDMQLALLPSDFPRGADWSMHACMLPARELGGDFYDVFSLPDGRFGLLVADVSGKGVAAAFFMAVSRTVLMDVAADGGAPHEVLARANDMLCLRNPKELFITVCYVVFEPATGALEYASGGHPPPLVRREDGRVDVLPACHDIVLAVMPEMPYHTLHASLGSGDTMVLFTDGITEAFSSAGEAYGDDRLLDWLSTSQPATGPRAMVDALVADVHRFVADTEASDDLTCLVLNREAKSGIGTIPQPVQMTDKTVVLDYSLHPAQLPQIAKLAQAVDRALSSRPDLAFSANLCLEELITNIITHGLKGQADHLICIRLSLSVEWLEIVLKDDVPPFDPFGQTAVPDLDRDVEDRPIGGLGVHLVKTLMDDARAHHDGSGNLIVLLKAAQKKSDDPRV